MCSGLQRICRASTEPGHGIWIGPCVLRPQSRGTVRLRSSNPADSAAGPCRATAAATPHQPIEMPCPGSVGRSQSVEGRQHVELDVRLSTAGLQRICRASQLNRDMASRSGHVCCGRSRAARSGCARQTRPTAHCLFPIRSPSRPTSTRWCAACGSRSGLRRRRRWPHGQAAGSAEAGFGRR